MNELLTKIARHPLYFIAWLYFATLAVGTAIKFLFF